MNACTCSDGSICCTLSGFAARFIQRRDIHSYQLNDGRYVCIHEPLHLNYVFAHLFGDITLGTYILNQDSEARFVVFDVDDENGFTRLLDLAKQLIKKNITSYLEESRRGGHLWLFFDNPVSGKEARDFADGILSVHQVNQVEVFPKQEKLSDGPGSLIRLPFGIHRLSGKRYGFFTPDEKKLAPTFLEQIYALLSPKTVPASEFTDYREYAQVTQRKVFNITLEPSDNILSERIKASVGVRDFVGRYVELKLTISGAIGLCPFHDDHIPSFGVNDKGNYWHCFAGCGGGSVIDFWMLLRDCDFKTAVTELAEIMSIE